MTVIAEAFVAVRPDTSGFTTKLKADIAEATKAYKPDIKLKVTPYVIQKDINEFVVAKIKATKATIMVEAVLDPKSTATIRQNLAGIKDQVVNVTAVVTNTRAATTAASAGIEQMVTPVLNEPALATIVERIEATKPVITVLAALDPASEARLKEQAVVPATLAASAGATAAGGAGRASRAAEVDAQAKATRRLALAEDELNAVTRAVRGSAINDSTAKEAQKQVTSSLARVESARAGAMRDEDAATEKQIAVTQKRIEQLQQELRARTLLSRIGVNQGVLANASPGPITSTEAASNLKLAQKNAADLGVAMQAAVASGNKNVAALVAGTQGLVDVQLAEAKSASEAAVAEEAKTIALAEQAKVTAGIQDQIAVLTATVDRATSADFTLTQQKAKLIAVDQKLALVTAELSKATSGASAADIASLHTLEAKVAAQKQAVITQIDAAAAAKRLTEQELSNAAAGRTTAAQARRGAAATGATFLGLRGAVLSASTGFLAATVAVTGLAKIVKTAEDLQHSLNVFQSVSGATAAQMAAVDLQARKLGADLSLPATSATDAAEAMTELAKAGLSVNETLAASKGVLQLSAAAGIGVQDAANIVATELNAFELAGNEATHVVDNLAGASIAAQGEITDFALAFQQASAVAHQVRLPFETTTAILTQFAKAGLHGSDAGTSLRTMLLRLVPTSKAAADAQAELGIHLNRSIPVGEQFLDLIDQYTRALAKLGPVAQQEALTKIFGQDAIRGASISLTKGSQALIDIEAQTNKAGAAAEITKGRTEGLGGSVEGLKSEVSTLAATIGSSLLPVLTSTAHAFATIASTANSAFTEAKKISDITIKPVGNALGGTDTLVKILIPALAAYTTKSLLSGRLRERAELRVEQAVLSVQDAYKRQAITQEQMNVLLETMGVNAADAEAIQIKAIAENDAASKKLLATKENILLVEKEIASVSSGNAFGAVAGAAGVKSASQAASQMGSQTFKNAAGVFVAGPAKSAQEWEASYGKIEASAVASSSVQVAAAEKVGLANVTSARTSAAAWARSNAAMAAGRIRGLGGLGAGIGLTVAGGLLPGSAGSIVSGAGEGAVIGSIVPGVGTAVGLAAGALFGAFTSGQNQSKEAKAKWDALTYEEQVATIDKLTAQGRRFLFEQVGVKLKENPYLGQAQTIIDSVFGGNAPADLTPHVKFVGDTKSLITPAIGPPAPIPLSSFQTTTTADNGPVATFLKTAAQNMRIRIAQFKENAQLQAQLELAQAELAGDSDAQDAALNKLIAIDERTAKSLERRLNAKLPRLQGYVISDEKERKRLYQEWIKVLQDEKGLKSQLATEAAFSISTDTQIAGIMAGSTKTLSDDLAAQQKVLEETNAALSKATGEKRDSLRIAQAQARANIIGTKGQIAEQATAAAKQAIENQRTELQAAAEAAGNIGAAENKYIAFLKEQIGRAGQTTAERLAAEQAYNNEIKKRQEALKAILDARINLREAGLDNALLRAQATESKVDDIKVFRGYIKLDRDRIAVYRRFIESKKGTALEVLNAQIQIRNLQGDIIRQQQAIKGTTDKASFSLSDLFKEAISQFNEFGSNIASRQGILSGGDLRATFAANIIASQRNPVADAISHSGNGMISEQQTTNTLLRELPGQIAARIRSGASSRSAHRDPYGPQAFDISSAAHTRAHVTRGGS